MSTDLNYVARLDTTQIMSGIAEIRSQVGMAFSAPTGFASPAASIGGGGFSGMNNVAAGVSAQFQNMFAGFGPVQSMFGGTFTNPAMALNPHYGMVQAQTSLEEEWGIHRGGLAAAQQMKPPGVSAATYALGVESNFINRQLDASHGAAMAAQSAFFGGAAGLAAGEVTSRLGGAVGGALGGALAGRLLGAGAAGAGAALGGLAGMWYGFDIGSDWAGGKIEKHYAEIEQVQGVTRELGELAGAGRGLSAMQRTELGISARRAAGDLKMDFNEMGDILALGRQSGMLPTATGDNSEKAREQFRNFARAIEEGSQVLGTSLAGATQVIKAAAQQGMSSQEGVIRAAGAGGPDLWMAQQARMSAFAGAGAGVGMSMGFTAAQGSGMFTGSLGAGAAAGLSHDEMRIMGGGMGAAAFVGSTQMQMASSPLGNLQMMAGMGGGLAGAGMMDLPGAAMAGLMSGGGDFLSNAGKFMVHQNEYRRGLGAGGIRTMARQQMQMGGEMIAELMPGLSDNEAQRMYAMSSMGMNPDQAKLLAGGGGGGGGRGSSIGGGMGADAQVRAVMAMQESRLNSSFAAPELETGRREFGSGYALAGAALGAGLGGGIVGGAVGGLGGLVAGNAGALWDLAGDVFGSGPGLLSSPTEKAEYYERQRAAEYDKRMNAAKQGIGYVEIDAGAGARFLKANLSGARLVMGGIGKGKQAALEASLVLSGVKRVHAGPGTTQIGDHYYDSEGLQKQGSGTLWDKTATPEQERVAAMAAASTWYEGSGEKGSLDQAAVRKNVDDFNRTYEFARTGKLDAFGDYVANTALYKGGMVGAAERLRSLAKGQIDAVEDVTQRNQLLKGFDEGGLSHPMVRSYLGRVNGNPMESLNGAYNAVIVGAVATKHTVEATRQREAAMLQYAYSPGSAIDMPLGGGAPGTIGEVVAHAVIRGATPESRYWNEMTRNNYWIASKGLAAAGKFAAADDLAAQAQAAVLTSNPEYRGIHVGKISSAAELARHDPDAAATAYARGLLGPMIGADKTVAAYFNDKTSVAKEAKIEQGIKDLQPPVKKREAGVLANTPGFGQQEAAMSSILRSLKHVESTLAARAKKATGGNGNTQGGGTVVEDGQ